MKRERVSVCVCVRERERERGRGQLHANYREDVGSELVSPVSEPEEGSHSYTLPSPSRHRTSQ